MKELAAYLEVSSVQKDNRSYLIQKSDHRLFKNLVTGPLFMTSTPYVPHFTKNCYLLIERQII